MSLKLTPRYFKICDTRCEKPHCGKSLVPFMNSTTSLWVTWSLIQLCTSCSLMLAFLFRLDYTCTCALKKQAPQLKSQVFGPVLWFGEPRHGARRPCFLAGI